jgi:multidrug efflux pump subunit AcrB
MNLPEIAIRRPVFAWMVMAALILFGLLSATRMGVSQLPDVDFPVVTIAVTYTGAAPEIVETNVVDIIEDAVMTVEGVRSVTSTSRYAYASITVEFELPATRYRSAGHQQDQSGGSADPVYVGHQRPAHTA